MEHYETVHILRDHKYSIAEIENMIPFELELYTDMIIKEQRAEHDVNVEPPPEDF